MNLLRQRGFTLIELMIAVAIVAILAAVALPSYDAYIKRSRVPVGLDALSSLYTRMEQRYQDTGAYTCPTTLPSAKDFTVSCALTGTQKFTATATGSSTLAGYEYTINEQGTRNTVKHPKGAVSNCWSIKGTVCDA